MSNILLFCKYRGIPGNSGFKLKYEDTLGPSHTPEDIFWSCVDDCLPTHSRGEAPENSRSLVVGCGRQSFEEFLSPNGVLFHSLRRLTRYGDNSVTAVDIGDGVGYDCFANGDKIKISERAMTGVTARELLQNSDSQEIRSLVDIIYLRRETFCGGLLVDVRGMVNFQVVLLRNETLSPLFNRLVFGGDEERLDTLVSLTSRTVRKGLVRVIHFLEFEEVLPTALLAETRILRLKYGGGSTEFTRHLIADHEARTAHLRRMQLEKELDLANICVQLESLTADLTTTAKRVRKARIAAEERYQKRLSELPSTPKFSPDDVSEALDSPRLRANHEVVADFWRLFQSVTTLHSSVIASQRESMRLIRRRGDGGACADSTPHPAHVDSSVLELIDDIIHFVCDRAVLVAEKIVERDESYAWFDILGCSRKLRGSETWCQPLRVQPQHVYPKISDMDFTDHTDLGSDTEEEAKGGLPLPVSPKKQVSSDGQGEKTASVVLSSGGDPTLRKLNITMKHDTEEADRKYLMAVYDSTTLVQDVTKYLKAGTKMIKHGRIGSPHERLFWVAPVANKMTLLWVDPEKRNSSAKTTVPLTDVSSVILGPFSRVFKRHPVTNLTKEFFLSFSLHLKDDSRTVDIVAPTLPDFEAWVLGICHMAQVDPRFGKKLKLTADEFTGRLSPSERDLCENWYIFPQAYIAVKDRIVGLREEVQQHLRLFGNNAEQAFIALGGIHLPQVNSKGAILMTKGELRHHCTPYNIDIFRVCEIWRVFNDQNLIYDLAFTPATNFSDKNRKSAPR